MKRAVFVFFVAATAVVPVTSRADVVQMPLGGKAVAVVKKGVVCGPLPTGWAFESDRRSVRPPPAGGEADVRRAIDVRVAESGSCTDAKTIVTLLATDPWPTIDPTGVIFYPDEGRVDLRGRSLAGVQVAWEAGGKPGQDSCIEPTISPKAEQCAVPLARGLLASTPLRWIPAGGRGGKDVLTYDRNGRLAEPHEFLLRPARVVLARILPGTEAVDISQGTGRILLPHPTAVAAADCGAARCEIVPDGILVRGMPGPATHLTLALKLAPRMYLARGEKLDTSVSATLPLLHCPLTIVSGAPLREADESQILLRMPQRCGGESRLRWTVGAEPAEVAKIVRGENALFVLLRVGRLFGDKVTITATRSDSEGGIIGSITTPTAPVPRPRALLELPTFGQIDFVPTNREASLAVAGIGDRARLVVLPVEGVYGVRADGKRFFIRGEESTSGYVSLRFGYRMDGLPPEFAGTTWAVVTEPVQRPVREASVPVPFTGGARPGEPMAELVCADKAGRPSPIEPGKPTRIPFESRDTCRVVIHQERLKPEFGLQEIVLEIDVFRADGTRRTESRIDERMVLRPGGDVRTIWLRATDQFDRILVRLSHVVDETRYVLHPAARRSPPSAQWSATVEGGWARLYVTVAIPAGLYRMNEPTGQLTLNFGVLSRLTWLDRQGKEGLLGLELGMMGVGLIPQRQGGVKDFPRTLAAVAGLGLRVPLGSGAAVGVHVWGAYEFRRDYLYTLDPKMEPTMRASHWAFIFGPSISIGNVGTNL